MDLKKVLQQMQEAGFDEQFTSGLTQEIVDDYEKNSEDLTGHPNFTINSGNYSGNSFVINGQYWYWKDTPGSQCGTTKNWRYGPVMQGSTHGIGGTCPQGYPWVSLYCVF